MCKSRQIASLLDSVVVGISAASLTFQFAGSYQFTQRSFYRAYAERRTQFPDVLFIETSYFVLCCEPYCFKCGSLSFYKRKSILKIFISRKNRPQQIFDKRNRIICAFMPSTLRCVQRLIIQILILCDLCFQGDIFPDIKSISIKKKRCKQSAHSSVPIIKRMDTKEIMNKNRDRNQRLKFHISDNPIIFLTYPI